MVDPVLLCRKHLLGEHVETHMAAGCVRRGKTLGRFLADGLVDPTRLLERHDLLAAEMVRRGYRHQSPLQEYVYGGPPVTIDVEANLLDLAHRCPECAERQRVQELRPAA